ncbi:MAG TPA: hypothetical protein VNP98_17230 [Chthoniobacterales bacterium]|nr:hypothetical protein [Chthoniobacterales bacterium]
MSLLFDHATVQLVRISCGECGIVFGVPDDWYQKRREDHGNWHCPNGHIRRFICKSDAEIARDERDRALRDAEFQRSMRESAEANLASARHKVAAERGAKTKLRKKLDRVSQGVCPCCNRTFQNLRRHIATKHPTFVAPVASSE